MQAQDVSMEAQAVDPAKANDAVGKFTDALSKFYTDTSEMSKVSSFLTRFGGLTSAASGEGLPELCKLLEKLLSENMVYIERIFSYNNAGLIQKIRTSGQLISEEYTEEGIAVKARVPRDIYGLL